MDTDSSRDNHGRVWNTRRNHIGRWFYLRAAGVPAEVDVYHCDMHAFDMLQPDSDPALEVARKFVE